MAGVSRRAAARARDASPRETADAGTVFVLGLAAAVQAQLFNAAAVVHRGRILGLVPKEKLPTYDVFYEARTFSRGGRGLALDADGVPLGDFLFGFDFGTIAVEVCEDAWAPDGPMRRRCLSGAEIVVNVSASPYRMGVDGTRREMLATRAADNQTVLVYANAVGAQDGLVYDGGGFVFQNGRLVQAGAALRRGLRQRRGRPRPHPAAAHRAHHLARGLRDLRAPRAAGAGAAQRRRDRRPDQAPLSGPARRQLLPALAIAARRRRARRRARRAVRGAGPRRRGLLHQDRGVPVARHRPLGRPRLDAHPAGGLARCRPHPRRRVRSGRRRPADHRLLHADPALAGATRTAAHELAAELGVALHTIPLDEAYDREVEAAQQMLGGQLPGGMTRQNVQARLRGQRMWNWANSSGALFLQTGDMSEKAVGYTTIGGDLEGALSVIANVPKTVVEALLARLHARYGFAGIAATLATRPGPGAGRRATGRGRPDAVPGPRRLPAPLRRREDVARRDGPGPGQRVPRRATAAYLATCAARFARLFTQSIYKWVQSPLALHVGSLDLDRERALQMPVVQRTEW